MKKWGMEMKNKGAKLQMMDKHIHDTLEGLEMADARYNTPKAAPKVPDEIVEQAIKDNDIYSEVRDLMLDAQRKQVAYGLEKYPETLNQDSWGHIETIEHIIEETVDQLHYLVMLKHKMMRNEVINRMLGIDVDFFIKNTDEEREEFEEFKKNLRKSVTMMDI